MMDGASVLSRVEGAASESRLALGKIEIRESKRERAAFPFHLARVAGGVIMIQLKS